MRLLLKNDSNLEIFYPAVNLTTGAEMKRFDLDSFLFNKKGYACFEDTLASIKIRLRRGFFIKQGDDDSKAVRQIMAKARCL